MSQQPSGTTPYTINLDRFHVYNPRALFADTDFVMFLVQLNGNNVVPPQTIRLNNVGKGDYTVGMQVPIPVFPPGDLRLPVLVATSHARRAMSLSDLRERRKELQR